MKRNFILLLPILFVLGCATVSYQKSNLTVGMINKSVVKGVTSQSEIMTLFGAPNIISKNKSGNELWTYDKISTDAKSSEGFGSLILAGIGSSKSSVTSKTFTFMIEFEENHIVKDYSYRSAEF